MSYLKKLKKLILQPKIGLKLLLIHTAALWPDKLYIKCMYYLNFGHKINLKNPKTFNEKLQWLKLYNHRPEYIVMADKVKAKDYVAEKLGKEYIIPTIGVWNSPDEIDFDVLPNKFVLKCNHNSGTGMCICRDKSKLDIPRIKAELARGLNENYFLLYREWPYKNIPRKIIAEKFMEDSNSEDLTDYKFFCFNGKPFMMYVSKDNALQSYTDFFDMDYNRLPIRMKDPNSTNPPAKPVEFEEMKILASKLSKGIPHLRVDFYVINHHVYFGELTFFHNAGFGLVNPPDWNLRLGSMIDIDSIKKQLS